MTFDSLLRQSMKEHHVNCADIARATGTTVAEVNKWRAGNSYPTPGQLLGIARAFGMHLDVLCSVDSWTK